MSYNSDMNEILSQKKAQDLFLQICEKNQWDMYLETEKRGFPINGKHVDEYYIIDRHPPPFENEKKASRWEHEMKTRVKADISEIIPKFDLFSVEQNSVSINIDTEKAFKILCDFIELGNLKTAKNLSFMGRGRYNNFKKWNYIYDAFNNYATQDISKSDWTYFFKNYSSTFTDRELKEIFDLIGNIQFDKKDLHEVLTGFCSNHLDQILEKTSTQTFILDRVKEILPEQISFYKNFLKSKQDDILAEKSLFSNPIDTYQTFHIHKDVIFKLYPLSFSQITTSEDYGQLLDNITNYLCKKPVLKKINAVTLDVSGKQGRFDNFIFTVNTKQGFNIELIKNFYITALQDASELTASFSKENSISMSKLKGMMQERYDALFNTTKLNMDLSEKQDTKAKNKI